jgi:secondary thiamine-phosphate synthase enzyme
MQEMLRIKTSKSQEVVDITGQVATVLARSRRDEGICTVFVRHATAAIIINENADPGFRLDVVSALDRIFPQGIWEHDKVDDNGAAHLKATILGPSETSAARGILRTSWSVPAHGARTNAGRVSPSLVRSKVTWTGKPIRISPGGTPRICAFMRTPSSRSTMATM